VSRSAKRDLITIVCLAIVIAGLLILWHEVRTADAFQLTWAQEVTRA